MSINYNEFRHQLTGLWPDILGQYGIEIPKMRGINSVNYPCPLCGGDDRAHWREVDSRLCLFCRHCAADSMHSPEGVIMEWAGLSFGELVNDLADYINHVPIERIEAARSRVHAPKFNLPPDDKRESEKSSQLLAMCSHRDIGGCTVYEKSGRQFIPVQDFAGQVVNVAWIGRDIQFCAGGVSYGAFSVIRKDDNHHYLVVSNWLTARAVAEQTGENVLIAWSPHNIKYICRNAPRDWHCKPVIGEQDAASESLCERMGWIKCETLNEWGHKKIKLTHKEEGEYA